MKYFSIENWKTQDGDPRMVKMGIHAILWLFIISALIVQFPFGTVGAGERGVRLQWDAVTGDIEGEGLYFKVPFIQKVKIMDIKIQKEQTMAGAASKDLQTVTTEIALNFHIKSDKVASIYQEVGREYKEKIIDPVIQESVKASTAMFTAEELITKREQVREEIKLLLREKLETRGIIIDEFNIVSFEFSEAFDNAIENKVMAEQNAFAAKNKLEQIKFEAEQKIAEAKGKAEAMNIEAQALLKNTQMLELRALEKWNGQLPQYMGSGSIPFIQIK